MWGMLTIVPLVQSIGPRISEAFGVIPIFKSHNPTGFSVLAGGIVLAVMVAPFIIAVTYEVLRTVPSGYREASLAVGATKWETIKYAVLPQTLHGIIAGSVLGASRALGETMAVLMVVGNVPKVSLSIFDPAYPLPALIANNYGEMMSIPLYDAALMAAALILADYCAALQHHLHNFSYVPSWGRRDHETTTPSPTTYRGEHLQNSNVSLLLAGCQQPGFHPIHRARKRITRIELGDADANTRKADTTWAKTAVS